MPIAIRTLIVLSLSVCVCVCVRARARAPLSPPKHTLYSMRVCIITCGWWQALIFNGDAVKVFQHTKLNVAWESNGEKLGHLWKKPSLLAREILDERPFVLWDVFFNAHNCEK